MIAAHASPHSRLEIPCSANCRCSCWLACALLHQVLNVTPSHGRSYYRLRCHTITHDHAAVVCYPDGCTNPTQIRDSGLSGVELMRALAVDDNGGTRLRGVSRKVRYRERRQTDRQTDRLVGRQASTKAGRQRHTETETETKGREKQ